MGAPHGTYPGGIMSLLSGSAEPQTGLVYQCPVGPGGCDGILGNNADSDRRLFDGDGKHKCVCVCLCCLCMYFVCVHAGM